MIRRPCLTARCPHLALTGKARCVYCERKHQHTRDHARGTRQQRGYDANYEQARAALHLEDRPPCHWCGAPATTADHDPPMAQAGVHYHLVPACLTCNYGRRARSR